jgi:hypothetical protein
MNKIKELIKNWLFKEEINKINNILYNQKELDMAVVEARDSYHACSNSLRTAQDMIGRCLDIGIDHGIKNPSWAVVCIKGKPETVRFMRLEATTAREIYNFLKRFESANIVFDSPYSREIFQDWR